MYIQISISSQLLTLMDNADQRRLQYLISTAKNGAGEAMDSECTPRGKHIIAEKIGAGCAVNAVFIGRIATGEVYAPALRERHPERDWILTRILWLSGIEEGRNKGQNNGKNLDSHDRYIYIHGAPDDVLMGQPGSRGCVRMRNADIIELFDLVAEGTNVIINE